METALKWSRNYFWKILANNLTEPTGPVKNSSPDFTNNVKKTLWHFSDSVVTGYVDSA